jgi:hypothetical protein
LQGSRADPQWAASSIACTSSKKTGVLEELFGVQIHVWTVHVSHDMRQVPTLTLELEATSVNPVMEVAFMSTDLCLR